MRPMLLQFLLFTAIGTAFMVWYATRPLYPLNWMDKCGRAMGLVVVLISITIATVVTAVVFA